VGTGVGPDIWREGASTSTAAGSPPPNGRDEAEVNDDRPNIGMVIVMVAAASSRIDGAACSTMDALARETLTADKTLVF
jgi:hypothetical protein